MGRKDRIVGSVGAYLLREGFSGTWETVVHRRSMRVAYSKNLLATPGGMVEKKMLSIHREFCRIASCITEGCRGNFWKRLTFV